MMRTRLNHYLNPIKRLGKKQYSFWFPFFVTVLSAILLELYTHLILHDPKSVGIYAIFIFIALIIYFAFRDGVLGGITTTFLTIAYYAYLIYELHYKGKELITSIETTIILGILYLLLAGIIGWLKQTIDSLIERESNEKHRLQAIIQQLPVGIIITDTTGKVGVTNKKLEQILNVKISDNFVIGKDVLLKGMYNGKELGPSQSPLLHAISTGRTVIRRGIEVIKKDGKVVFIELTASPIRNSQGKIIAAAEIVNDITLQKELDARKDDFVNMASHELKTPITSMMLYLDLLSKQLTGTRNEKNNKTLENIKIQVRRLQRLVNDLLDVSRIQTGKLSFENEKFRLDQLIDETIEVIQGSAKQKIIFQKAPVITIEGDRFRIYQVLTNILTNATKYSGSAKEILIKVKKESGKAFISVQDHGIGIAKSEQKRIFERLYQVTDDTQKTFPGFGMGLYISREIIRRHKGNIWVESEKGKGSTFFISLPLSKA